MARSLDIMALASMAKEQDNLEQVYKRTRKTIQQRIYRERARGKAIPSLPPMPEKIGLRSFKTLQKIANKITAPSKKHTALEEAYKKRISNIKRSTKRLEKQGYNITVDIPQRQTGLKTKDLKKELKRLQEFDVKKYVEYKGEYGKGAFKVMRKERREEKYRQQAKEEALKRINDQFAKARETTYAPEYISEGDIAYHHLLELVDSDIASPAGHFYLGEFFKSMVEEMGYDEAMKCFTDIPQEAYDEFYNLLYYNNPDGDQGSTASFWASLTKFGELLTEQEARAFGAMDDVVTG